MAEHTEANKTTEPVEEQWLRGMRLNDLLRLARLCNIDVGDKPVDREDVIKILCVARQENQLADAQFRDLTRPARAFDVLAARETLEQRVDEEMGAQKQELESSTKSLIQQLEPLKSYATQTKIAAGILAVIVGFVGINIWSSLNGIGELKTRLQTNLDEARSNLIEMTGKLNVAESDLSRANEDVRKLQIDLQSSLIQAKASNQNSQDMIVALCTNTGTQMIGKLNARLDRLRSMKVYHLKPLMNELALDIESDNLTLEKLAKVLDDRQESPEYKFITSLAAISEAVSNLKLVYDEKDEIQLKALSDAYEVWEKLESPASNITTELANMFDNAPKNDGRRNLTRLKANVFQVAAGLAIQEYRESATKDPDLLRSARDKCMAAIGLDRSAPVPHLYNGLISSLEINEIRKRNGLDIGERLKLIDVAKALGAESYDNAAQVKSSPELRAYALNGLSYLLVKTSDSYVEAAKDPACKKKDEYLEIAQDLLQLAKQEIERAQGSVVAIDPVILTTQADIEILSLQFPKLSDSDNPEEQKTPEQKYQDILSMLESAVENGYSGYTGPMEEFFNKRPHFKHLASLNPNYQKDVCEAVHVTFEEPSNTNE